MTKKLYSWLLHYKIPHLLIASIIVLAGDYITRSFIIFCNSNNLLHPFTPEQITNGTHLFFLYLYCYHIFRTLRQVRYSDQTDGRNYLSDHTKYEKSYYGLVEYFKDADPYKIRKEDLPVESWKETDGVVLGKIGKRLIKRDSDAPGNLCVYGLPGSHKTTSQIIPTALRFGGSVLCIDIKGDVLHWTKDKRPIKIFNPEDPINSYHFDPFTGITSMSIDDRKLLIRSLADIIIEDDPKDKYFIPGGKQFFCGISLYLLSENINISFMEIIHQILTGNAISWVKTIKASSCLEAQEYTNGFYGANEKNVCGCYDAASKSLQNFTLGALSVLLTNEGNCISPEDLANGFDIYIELPQDKIKVYAPITTIIVQSFMTFFMQRNDSSSGQKKRPIIMLLDEFPQLRFDFDILSAGLATLRSKGVTFFLAQQSLAQISKRYGNEGLKEIMDNCQYISIMSAQDPSSREYFQRLIGQKKVLNVSTSSGSNKSHSKTVSPGREYIYQSEDFSNLGDDLVIYANGKYIQCQKTNCYE